MTIHVQALYKSSQICIWQHITSRNDELYLFLKVTLQVSFRVVLKTDEEDELIVKTLLLIFFCQADVYTYSLFSVVEKPVRTTFTN